MPKIVVWRDGNPLFIKGKLVFSFVWREWHSGIEMCDKNGRSPVRISMMHSPEPCYPTSLGRSQRLLDQIKKSALIDEH